MIKSKAAREAAAARKATATKSTAASDDEGVDSWESERTLGVTSASALRSYFLAGFAYYEVRWPARLCCADACLTTAIAGRLGAMHTHGLKTCTTTRALRQHSYSRKFGFWTTGRMFCLDPESR